MLAKNSHSENSVIHTVKELERISTKLQQLEVHLYRRRLTHLKSLRKRVNLIHREIDKAYHDAYQTYEIDLHNLAINVREFQDDINSLRQIISLNPILSEGLHDLKQ